MNGNMRMKCIVLLGLIVLFCSCKIYREISDETLLSIVKARSADLNGLKQEFLSSPEIRAVYGFSLSKLQLTSGPAGFEAIEASLPDHVKASRSRIKTLMRNISAQSAWKNGDHLILEMAYYGVDGWECTKCLQLEIKPVREVYLLLPSLDMNHLRRLLVQLDLRSKQGLQSDQRSAVFYKKIDDQTFVFVSCLR